MWFPEYFWNMVGLYVCGRVFLFGVVSVLKGLN